jgi:hypothetical protein
MGGCCECGDGAGFGAIELVICDTKTRRYFTSPRARGLLRKNVNRLTFLFGHYKPC